MTATIGEICREAGPDYVKRWTALKIRARRYEQSRFRLFSRQLNNLLARACLDIRVCFYLNLKDPDKDPALIRIWSINPDKELAKGAVWYKQGDTFLTKELSGAGRLHDPALNYTFQTTIPDLVIWFLDKTQIREYMGAWHGDMISLQQSYQVLKREAKARIAAAAVEETSPMFSPKTLSWVSEARRSPRQTKFEKFAANPCLEIDLETGGIEDRDDTKPQRDLINASIEHGDDSVEYYKAVGALHAHQEKAINFGSNYGMGSANLAKSLNAIMQMQASGKSIQTRQVTDEVDLRDEIAELETLGEEVDKRVAAKHAPRGIWNTEFEWYKVEFPFLRCVQSELAPSIQSYLINGKGSSDLHVAYADIREATVAEWQARVAAKLGLEPATHTSTEEDIKDADRAYFLEACQAMKEIFDQVGELEDGAYRQHLLRKRLNAYGKPKAS